MADARQANQGGRDNPGQESSQAREMRTGVGGGPANPVTAEEENRLQREARDNDQQRRDMAQQVVELFNDVHDTMRELPGDPVSESMKGHLARALEDLTAARLVAEAVLTDTPVLRAGPNPGAMAARSFPTPNSGAASSLDHAPALRQP